MAIYLKHHQLAVKGNMTAEGYKDWNRLDSFSFGNSRHITMEAGHMSNCEATRPSLTSVSISKLMNTASSLSYSKTTMSYTAADRANKGASPERVGYDLESGKKL
ncbi:hypothetical protein BTA51_24780 [Hahella sp. CCB-MM4]|uniref:type VI secretion system tube protein Hcp n=1 Tax=Hahella sp. (strain CCB-MM4) TaxID=1926491 RepID=UPI000B9B9F3A|nr:type VI secretion system tube protein Hcp [Hahella sp. CCB-MM4]OZG70585.1 hypothetical protein BTA51_24780 [Hahella sp. CCB-MM4]